MQAVYINRISNRRLTGYRRVSAMNGQHSNNPALTGQPWLALCPVTASPQHMHTRGYTLSNTALAHLEKGGAATKQPASQMLEGTCLGCARGRRRPLSNRLRLPDVAASWRTMDVSCLSYK